MAAMASLAAVAASTSFAPSSVSVSFSGLRAGRALASAAAFPRLRLGARPRSLPLRICASADSQTFLDVQKIIAEQLVVEKEKIQFESEFSALGADSLDTVEIMMALEEKFSIHLDADKGESIKTVKDVVGLIDETMASGK